MGQRESERDRDAKRQKREKIEGGDRKNETKETNGKQTNVRYERMSVIKCGFGTMPSTHCL